MTRKAFNELVREATYSYLVTNLSITEDLIKNVAIVLTPLVAEQIRQALQEQIDETIHDVPPEATVAAIEKALPLLNRVIGEPASDCHLVSQAIALLDAALEEVGRGC